MPLKTTPSRNGFTLIELLTVIAIIGLLAAILIPVVGNMRQKAGTTKTMSNLRQVHNGFQMYTSENKNQLPAPRKDNVVWSLKLYPYLNNGKEAENFSDLAGTVFTSPNAAPIGEKDNPAAPTVSNPSNQGFGMNSQLPSFEDESMTPGYGEGRVPAPVRLKELSRTMLAMDCNAPIIFGSDWFANQFTTYVENRHDGNNTVLFCDGSVELIPHERFRSSGDGALLPFSASPGSPASLFWRGL